MLYFYDIVLSWILLTNFQVAERGLLNDCTQVEGFTAVELSMCINDGFKYLLLCGSNWIWKIHIFL